MYENTEIFGVRHGRNSSHKASADLKTLDPPISGCNGDSQ